MSAARVLPLPSAFRSSPASRPALCPVRSAVLHFAHVHLFRGLFAIISRRRKEGVRSGQQGRTNGAVALPRVRIGRIDTGGGGKLTAQPTGLLRPQRMRPRQCRCFGI